MKLVLRIALVILAATILLAGGAYLLPLSSLIPPVEREASATLRQPVKIGSLHVVLLPLPHASLEHIRIGKAGEIGIDNIVVAPALSTLLSPVKVLRDVELNGVSAPLEVLITLLPSGQPGKPPAVAVERVAARDVKLTISGSAIPPFDTDVTLSEAGQPTHVELRSRDRKLTILAAPQKGHMALKVTAKDWTVPVGEPIVFNELAASAELRESTLAIQALSGRLYEGTLSGNADLGWGQLWTLNGNASLQGVAIEPLCALFTRSVKMDGTLDTRARFRASATQPSELVDKLRVDGSFVVRHGVLHGVDLASAARLVRGAKSTGGTTQFNEFTGNYHVVDHSYRLDQLRVRSGILNAQGDVAIAPSRALQGKLTVELKAGVSLVKVPLHVAGTAQTPSIYPTAGAATGALLGTAILPGPGTSVGASVGEALGDLLRKK
jgi:hypothetical protein